MKGVGVATAAVEERLLAVRRAQERVLGTLQPSGGMGPDGGQVQLPEIGSLGLVLAQPQLITSQRPTLLHLRRFRDWRQSWLGDVITHGTHHDRFPKITLHCFSSLPPVHSSDP
jgi:hypothetical protein